MAILPLNQRRLGGFSSYRPPVPTASTSTTPTVELTGTRGAPDPTTGTHQPGAAYDASGKPIDPGFTSYLNPKTGLLGGQFLAPTPNILPTVNQTLGGIKYDPAALDAIKTRAMSTGPSAWASMMTQQQGLDEQNQLQRAATQNASGMANARAQLASRGGLTGGAAERLARSGSRNLMASSQDISRQGMTDRLGIGVQDENQKLGLLQSIPGMETQRMGADLAKAGLQEKAGEFDAKNDFNAWQGMIDSSLKSGALEQGYRLGSYSTGLKGWGAEKTADAMNPVDPDDADDKWYNPADWFD